MAYRTHTCGALRKEDQGKTVSLAGWIHKIRLHGSLAFLDLRDRYGITQVVIDTDQFPQIKHLRKESVIQVQGEVVLKPQPNPKLATGAIEVKAQSVIILAEAAVLPLEMDESINTHEDTRLKYRFLDLRRESMKNNIILRHKVVKAIHDFMDKEGFLHIETPYLARSTPEGARDFLVPSRLYPGKFFALPQSPQLFKQLLMVSGMDKYYQIARCFRDEDLRADRQFEFTQVDIEMSFVERDDVLAMNERLIHYIFKEVLGKEIKIPFPRLSYEEAMTKYGSDKPDLRFELPLSNLTSLLKKSDFGIFQQAEYIAGLKIKAEFSRKAIDKYTKFVQENKAKGLLWLKMTDKLEGAAAKYLSETIQEQLIKELNLQEGEYLFIIADTTEIAQTAMGLLRKKLAQDLGLIPEDVYAFAWIIDFPMFEFNEEENRLVAMHHPFTMPHPEDIPKIEKEPLFVRALAYDLTLNGNEVAGGSIRIHDATLQRKIFSAIGLSQEEAEEKFGFLLRAFQYGVPPHGGIAYGLDRLVAIIAGTDSIRDVIAFPRNKQGINPLDESPNDVREEQLDELNIAIKEENEENE